MPSPRNKTIRLTEEETQRQLCRCVFPRGRIVDYADKVVCADLFEAAPLLPRGIADLIIADPPYNLTKSYGESRFCRRSEAEYAEFTEKWLDAVIPLLKADGTMYVCCDLFSGMIIAPILAKKLVVRNRITWQREKGRGADKNWKNALEDIWFCTAGEEYRFNLDEVKQLKKVVAPYRKDGKPRDWFDVGGERVRLTCPSNFWDDVTVPYWSMEENTSHPAQKSEKLLAKLILASSDKGDLVLDPFGGSGSSAVAAKKLGRLYLTVEREREYCALAAYRLSRAREGGRIQGMENGVFFPRSYRGGSGESQK